MSRSPKRAESWSALSTTSHASALLRLAIDPADDKERVNTSCRLGTDVDRSRSVNLVCSKRDQDQTYRTLHEAQLSPATSHPYSLPAMQISCARCAHPRPRRCKGTKSHTDYRDLRFTHAGRPDPKVPKIPRIPGVRPDDLLCRPAKPGSTGGQAGCSGGWSRTALVVSYCIGAACAYACRQGVGDG